jgi:hypothetical protein
MQPSALPPAPAVCRNNHIASRIDRSAEHLRSGYKHATGTVAGVQVIIRSCRIGGSGSVSMRGSAND